MDRTDIREKREGGREEREGEKRGGEKSREEDPASFFSLVHSSFPPLLSALLHTVFTMPFQNKMRIKLPLHIRHGISIS